MPSPSAGPASFCCSPRSRRTRRWRCGRSSTARERAATCSGQGSLRSRCAPVRTRSRISLNGPMKDAELLERAIRAGGRITLDSVAELARTRQVAERIGIRAMIRLRVRPDLVGRDEPSEMSPAGLSVRARARPLQGGNPDRGPPRTQRGRRARSRARTCAASTFTSVAIPPIQRYGAWRSMRSAPCSIDCGRGGVAGRQLRSTSAAASRRRATRSAGSIQCAPTRRIRHRR